MFRSGFANASSYRAAGKADRLLRAAVTSFCANTRPTRGEIVQFDDLAGPLLGGASEETLRFMTAALSESSSAPPALVRRLADLPVGISAPLLMRSPVLTPIDLLALIARHGPGHGRAIALRPDLDERILLIVRTLEETRHKPAPASPEETRDRLRAMMQPAQDASPRPATPPVKPAQGTHLRWQDEPTTYLRLRSTALAGAPVLFHTALADALAIQPAQARAIVEDTDPARLIVALRALSLGEEEAFLIMQCLRPVHNRHGVAIFLDAWRAVSREDAARAASGWQEACASGAGKLRAS